MTNPTTSPPFLQPLSKEKPTYIPKGGVLNIIWFSVDGIGFSVAKQLIEERNNVIVAQVQDLKDIEQESEKDTETKRRRLSAYDGLIDKEDALSVIEKMRSIKNKDEWIVWFDFNTLAPLAEKVLAMGFTKGLFPTKEDLTLESDRDKAKAIVREHYPDLSVAERHEFSSIDEGIDFLEETTDCWVLKGNSDEAKTVVPANDDAESCRHILIDALESNKKHYESDGFILERKIYGNEITPQCVWLDGVPVFYDIDFENKPIGAGNIGIQTGAMQTLVVKSEKNDKINKIAFPKWAHEQAKKHVGLFVMDAGLIEKDGKCFFTEYCSQRFGYDSFFAEIEMAGGATQFFTKLMAGDSPLDSTFGSAVRGLNLHKDDKERRVLEGVSMHTEDEKSTFVYEVKLEDDRLVSTGNGWDLVVFTGKGETPNEAIAESYVYANMFAFEDMHLRPEFDMTSYEYPTSIPKRYSTLNHVLFEQEEFANHDRFKDKKRMDEIEQKLESALSDDHE